MTHWNAFETIEKEGRRSSTFIAKGFALGRKKSNYDLAAFFIKMMTNQSLVRNKKYETTNYIITHHIDKL